MKNEQSYQKNLKLGVDPKFLKSDQLAVGQSSMVRQAPRARLLSSDVFFGEKTGVFQTASANDQFYEDGSEQQKRRSINA